MHNIDRGQSKPLCRLNSKDSLEDINFELGFCEKEGYRLQKKDITNWGYYKSQGEETSPSKSHVT